MVDDARKQGTTIGPVVDQSQLDQDMRYIDIGAKEGAKLHVGGERLNREKSGFYLSPGAVHRNHATTCSINREEIFGPVASVIRVKDYDEALAVANDTPFGLCSGVVTTSLKKAAHFRRNAEAGMVMVNLPTAGVDYHVPFGGRKGSSATARGSRGAMRRSSTPRSRPPTSCRADAGGGARPGRSVSRPPTGSARSTTRAATSVFLSSPGMVWLRDLIARMHAVSAAFFRLPPADEAAAAGGARPHPRLDRTAPSYLADTLAAGAERAADWKEGFSIGPVDTPADLTAEETPYFGRNLWPSRPEGLRRGLGGLFPGDGAAGAAT